MLIMLITIELQTYPQKPSISNPLIIKSTIHNIPAFIIILKIPRVNILMGRDKILTIGLTSILNKPRSKPAIKEILNLFQIVSPDIHINGKKYEVTAIEKVSITQFKNHFSRLTTLSLIYGYFCIY